MATREVPHDAEAERYVLGCCMLAPDVIPDLIAGMRAEDFYSPAHGATFAAIEHLWTRGEGVDAKTVSAHLNGTGPSDGELLTMITEVPATSNVGTYGAIVVQHAARRQLLRVASEIVDRAYRMDDPGDIVDYAQTGLATVELPVSHLPEGLSTMAEFASRPEALRQEWVIPGLLRRDWRVTAVAPEGQGKTLVLQQVGLCASQGIHPFDFEKISPIRVLFVDLENPGGRISDGYRKITPHNAQHAVDYDDERAWIWHREGGLNLRTRHDRTDLEAVIASVRPDLMCIGPAYKMSVRNPGEGYEEPAMEVTRILDGLRMRYRFALLMEDHAPQATGGRRDLRPINSSVWLRWPDIGLALTPDQTNKKLELKRFRGDRMENDWPDELERGGVWPWTGIWPNGRNRQERF